MAKHRPVEVLDARARSYIKCVCGFSTHEHPSLDEAWEEYDEHTMKE